MTPTKVKSIQSQIKLSIQKIEKENNQTREPFHPTVFVDIRKRMGASNFDAEKLNKELMENTLSGALNGLLNI